MKHLRLLIVVLAVIAAGFPTYAFDGQRKGVVGGFGLGVAPVANWSHDELGIDETGSSYAFRLFAGYAWNDRNMIVGDITSTARKSKVLNEYIIQTPESFLWYHYFRPRSRTFYTVIGGGYMYLDGESCGLESDGWHITLGGGYEFAKQLQVGAYYVGGWTDREGMRFGHHLLTVLVTAVAY